VPLSAGQTEELLRAAREVAKFAHCPFSHFHVGAAVLAQGKVFRGCNVENPSFGLTTCAERVAIFNAVSSGAPQIDAIAVACPDAPNLSEDNTKMPCGACRQVLAEFSGLETLVIVDGVGEFSLSQLLPKPFRL
jgi:cytidine deaminase